MDRWRTTAGSTGADALSASSSESDSTAGGGGERGELPYAALDGPPDTEWVSGAGRPGRRGGGSTSTSRWTVGR